MKVAELLTEATKKYKPPKPPKPRPRKTLWFGDSRHWKTDLDLSRPGAYELHQEENEESIYALDKDRRSVYGAWYKKKNRGVTFDKPRPYHAVVHPRHKLRKF